MKIDDDYSHPLVQVLTFGSRSKRYFCCQTGKDEWINQVMKLVVDSDGITLNCKIATQMKGFIGVLAEGVVIKIL